MTKAKAVVIPVTPFQQNCTLLWCEDTKRAVVIDPGGDLPDVHRAIVRAGVADGLHGGANGGNSREFLSLSFPRKRESRSKCTSITDRSAKRRE